VPRYNYPGYKSTGEGWLGARPGTKGGYHGGTDNPAAPGTPVYAEHGGKIFRSGPINGYGMSVIVESTAPDGTRFYELYGHLGPGPLPAPDTEIVAGEPIPGATIGTKEYVQSMMRGLTSGPHLHREIISGRFQLNKEGGLGLYSSEIEHKPIRIHLISIIRCFPTSTVSRFPRPFRRRDREIVSYGSRRLHRRLLQACLMRGLHLRRTILLCHALCLACPYLVRSARHRSAAPTEAAPYIKEDARIQTWGLGLTSALGDLNTIGQTSTFNAGPLQVRASGLNVW
jgi:hypothetical protein